MTLTPRRLFFGTTTALVLAAFAASLVSSRVSETVGVRRRAIAAAERLAGALEREGAATRAVSLAYLERARLGLGSPYRLIDQAMHDPRLPDSVAHDVSWSIIGALLAGRSYEVDPRALDMISQPGRGAGHLAVIEEAMAAADDPRIAETSLRIAYALAASNGTTSLTSLPIVAEVVAQVRDRALAEQDLRSAVRRAEEDGVDLIDELIHLRAERELAVERPLLVPLTEGEREAAIEAAPELLRRIEAIVPVPAVNAGNSRLSRKDALALAAVASDQPPLAAMRVTVTGRVPTLRLDSLLPQPAIPVIMSAANEESLVAAFAYADELSEGRSASLRRLMVSAGVALRAHAQDRVWFAGDTRGSIGTAIGRFGLKSITFDRAVPTAWRPFYAHMISSALEDFRRAVPGYDPAGLSFRVEMGALPDSALAMHDPRTHTIRLSALTPSGTLAHELAHDVDWQAARRLFTRSGGYATDRSLRESTIRLASSVRGLTSARIAGRGRISPHGSSRPAEVFARSVDWFVADALAASGRSNGFLSAIEDPLLAGFASMPADAPSLESAGALVSTLGEMTYVPDSLTRAYVQRWSTLEALDPAVVMLRAMEAAVITRRMPQAPEGLSAGLLTDLATGSLCYVDAMRRGTPYERLLAMAIDARGRGILMRRARFYSPGTRPAWARAMLGEPPVADAAAEEISRRTTASVAEGFARAGLFELAPAPFRPRCE